MTQTYALLLVSVYASVAFGQRGSFAGTRPIGFPELENKTTTTADGLGNRFGEGDGTTQRLPLEALGDRDLVERLSKLPIDKQPFWFINWQALEENRKNPQTYPQRPSQFNQPFPPNTDPGTNAPNSGTPNSNSGTPNSNSGTPNSNSGTLNSRFGTPNSNSGIPNSNFGTPNSNSGVPNKNTVNANSNVAAASSSSVSASSNFGLNDKSGVSGDSSSQEHSKESTENYDIKKNNPYHDNNYGAKKTKFIRF